MPRSWKQQGRSQDKSKTLNPYEEQYFQDITAEDIRTANRAGSRDLYMKLKRKDAYSKLKLTEAIAKSHHNVKQVSQGKTLYATIEANGDGILPKVELAGGADQGKNAAGANRSGSKKDGKRAEQSSIPIFENDQIMEAVGNYLDLSTLKTQFIKTDENSEFNQLLKLKNFLRKKKSTEIVKTLQLDILKKIRETQNQRDVKDQGQKLLGNYFKMEISKSMSTRADTHQVSKESTDRKLPGVSSL